MKPTIYESDEYKCNKSIINEIMKTRKYWKQEEFEIFEKFLIEFCTDEFKKLTSIGNLMPQNLTDDNKRLKIY